ncbi:MAG: hypothetical protein HY347_10945 [candidate division NC10 bacterium]|nr:hypothetical protein [candidate division NC10 bacterium]
MKRGGGGEQQMLALARGLMADPKLLLLDDPFFSLAPKAAGMLEQTIKDLPREGFQSSWWDSM